MLAPTPSPNVTVEIHQQITGSFTVFYEVRITLLCTHMQCLHAGIRSF